MILYHKFKKVNVMVYFCEKSNDFYNTLLKVKEKDPLGVLVLFNLKDKPSERYERLAGISIGVDLGKTVIIDAVSKGFDGREVSKSICTHERYIIPWFNLRSLSIENFKNYQTFQISNEEYQETRKERIKFLKSIGLDPNIFTKYVPENYQPIPDIIWLDIIKKLLKKLEKNEDFLKSYGFTNFAISGHTEKNAFAPWHIKNKKKRVGEHMTEELFDILDEFGQKTNKIKARTLVHRDGDWHKAVHIWIINDQEEILLQRRSKDKDSDPNMLDISCAGHLSTGDSSLIGACRELKEELNLDIDSSQLQFITTLKRSPKHDDNFVDNEFDDIYLLKTTKKITDLRYQTEEISEIFFVPYKKFKEMVAARQPDLVDYPDEYPIIFNLLDKLFSQNKNCN